MLDSKLLASFHSTCVTFIAPKREDRLCAATEWTASVLRYRWKVLATETTMITSPGITFTVTQVGNPLSPCRHVYILTWLTYDISQVLFLPYSAWWVVGGVSLIHWISESDMDHRICLFELFACACTQGTTVYALFWRTFVSLHKIWRQRCLGAGTKVKV